MKKQITLIGTTLLFSTLLGAVSASAAEKNTEANPSTVQTQVTGQLQLSENGGYDPNPPSDLNKKNDIRNSYFGISYFPTTFDFGTQKLLDSINRQTITANRNNKTFNIGVKDKRRSTDNDWTLFAKLDKKAGNDNEGILLKMLSIEEAQRNTNNGIEEFRNNDLTEQLKKDGKNEILTNKNTSITIENTPIMYTNKGKFVNGVYDLNLGDVILDIPDASKISTQIMDINVKWCLENTPSNNSQLIDRLKNLFVDAEYTNLKDEINSQELSDVEKLIYQIPDPEKQQYNLTHFNKYAKGHLVHWNIHGDNKVIGSAKIITNNDNTQAKVIFANILSSNFKQTQLPIFYKLERNGNTILKQDVNNNNTSHEEYSSEVKPGDILTVHFENNPVSVYPGNYFDNYLSADKKELRYKISDNFQLDKVE